MKANDFATRFPKESGIWDAFRDLNPLDVFENYYFEIKNATKNDYRTDAINRCLEEKVAFVSTNNSIFSMARRFVTITCPCGKTLSGKGGGGNSSLYHIDFECDCGTKFILTLPPDGISVAFK